MDPTKLFETNRALAHWVIQRYFPEYGQEDDMNQVAALGLWKACITFRSDKGTFSTYAVAVIKNELLMELRRRGKHNKIQVCGFDDPVVEDGNLTVADVFPDPKSVDFEEEIALKELIGRLKLSPRQQEVLVEALTGKRQSDIARTLGLSTSYVSRIMTSIRKKILIVL